MKKVVRGLGVLCVVLVVFAQSAWAILDVSVTQGVRRPTPLALEAFPGDLAVGQSVSAIIRADLGHSGRFKFVAQPDVPGHVHWQDWRQQGAEALITGRLQPEASGRYQVKMTVLGLYGGMSAGRQINQDRLASVVLSAKRQGLYQLGHRLSDVVFEKLTGTPGIFSTKVAYVTVERRPPNQSIYRLVVADIDGRHPRVLLSSSEPIMSPAWSSDGRRLLYVSFEKHRAKVVMQTLKTGKRQVLSRSSGINGAPTFSPDGRQVALVRTVDGNPKLYTLNLSTGQFRQLTHGWSIDTEPSWSPDGRSLLFTSNRDGSPQVYQYRFADQAIRRLTFVGRYNARASWLPNGKGFILLHQTSSGFVLASSLLSDNKLQVFSPPGKIESPSMAPNGQMVLYTRHDARGHTVLARISLDGLVRLTVPVQSGEVLSTAWSPFVGDTAS